MAEQVLVSFLGFIEKHPAFQAAHAVGDSVFCKFKVPVDKKILVRVQLVKKVQIAVEVIGLFAYPCGFIFNEVDDPVDKPKETALALDKFLTWLIETER